MFAAFAITVTLGVVWIFAHYMTLATYLTNMVALIGLGIAIDYSLLMVYRYREERKGGLAKDEAVVRTMETAGRAVVFSGTAVAIGLALMLFMPLPFMRGFGLAGLLIPLVSVLAALTLLPVLLYWLEDRLDRVPLVPRKIVARREDDERNFWARLAATIMRRPLVFALGTTAVLLALAPPIIALELGPGSNEGMPQHLEAVQGLNILTDAVGAGAISPTKIVIDTGRPGGARDPQVVAANERLASLLRGDAGGGRGRRRRTADGRSIRPLRPDRRDREARVRRSAGAGVRRPAARRHHPGRGVSGRRGGPGRRRAAARCRLPRPHVRRVPVARPRRPAPDLPPARCAPSARSCCR